MSSPDSACWLFALQVALVRAHQVVHRQQQKFVTVLADLPPENPKMKYRASAVVHPGDLAGIHFSVWPLAKQTEDRPDKCLESEPLLSNMGEKSVTRIPVCEPSAVTVPNESTSGNNPIVGLEIGVQGVRPHFCEE